MTVLQPFSRTLQSLEDYSLMSELPSVIEGKDRVLLRVIRDQDNRPVLKAILGSEITVWDRICYFFGSRDLLLSRVVELATQALHSEPSLLHTLDQSPEGLRRTILSLNRKIIRYNIDHAYRSRIHELSLERFEARVRGKEAALPSMSVVRPIINPGNKCYFISVLTALCASVECHKMIEQMGRNELSKLLHLCFHELLQPIREPISLHSEIFSKLVSVFSRYFPPVSLFSFSSQDAHECIINLLNRVFEGSLIFSWRGMTIFGEEHEKVVEVSPIQRGLIWTIYPKGQNAPLHLQNIFTPLPPEETVEDVEEGQTTPVRELSMLCGEIPPFIPFHIQRSSYDKIRGAASRVNFSKVLPPLHLMVSHSERERVPYVLRSIVVNTANSMRGGHYITYIPEPNTPCDPVSGIPLTWTLHDDGAPSIRVCWEQAKDDIAGHGYLYLYDLER